MFDELRELADTVREHAPRIVDEVHRGVEALVIGAESLARIADKLDGGIVVKTNDQEEVPA